MESKKILEFFLKNGLLVDNDVLNLFSEAEDLETVRLIIEKIGVRTNKKIITRNLFEENREKVEEVFSNLPSENQRKVEKLKIRLGLNIQISKEITSERNFSRKAEVFSKGEEGDQRDFVEENYLSGVKVTTTPPVVGKKLVVEDFVTHFRNRFNEMKNFLQSNPQLDNLTSINKISTSRQSFSLIGIVSDKNVTKNKNLILEIEDLTGKIKVLINQNKPELFAKAEDITLDSIIPSETRMSNFSPVFASFVLRTTLPL